MSVRRLAPAETQPAAFAFTPENEAFADAQVAKYPEGRQASAVIPLLWQAQKQHGGWLPKPAIEAVAARLGMPTIRVVEVATFYTMFNLEPVGRHFIQLCGTVPCHVKGAIDLKQALLERVGDERHVTADGLFSWLEVECLGACCNAPMVQINDDYYEDLTPELLLGLLDDLAAGRSVSAGPQAGRRSSEPAGEMTTLRDEALFDGSLVGSWRKRFEQAPVTEVATGEGAAVTGSAPGDLKLAKPEAGRASQSGAADAPAQRAADGKEVLPPLAGSGGADKAGLDARPATPATPTASGKSYTMTPSKPEDGRIVAGATGTTPLAGTPPSAEPPRRDGSESKPVGSDKDASPGVAPKE